jgi:hypothetical protein
MVAPPSSFLSLVAAILLAVIGSFTFNNQAFAEEDIRKTNEIVMFECGPNSHRTPCPETVVVCSGKLPQSDADGNLWCLYGEPVFACGPRSMSEEPCPENIRVTRKLHEGFVPHVSLLVAGIWVSDDLPSTTFVGGEFGLGRRISGGLYLTASLGLGLAQVGEEDSKVALTESLGLQYRFTPVWALGTVVRHYVAIDGDGDSLHAVLPALELNINMTRSLQATVAGGVGWGRFLRKEQIAAASTVASAEYATFVEESSIRSLSAGLRLSF